MPATQANVEYWFRLLYECLHGACYGSVAGPSAFIGFFTQLWLWIVFVGYAVSIIALLVLVYCTMRLFEIRKREKKFYLTVIPSNKQLQGEVHPRWLHVQSLAAGSSPSEWREAIIEADILLDDMLLQRGYVGESVADKLKSADPADFKSLQDAWDGHKVRNQIAHEGSAFNISEELTRRTLAKFENVFREFKII